MSREKDPSIVETSIRYFDEFLAKAKAITPWLLAAAGVVFVAALLVNIWPQGALEQKAGVSSLKTFIIIAAVAVVAILIAMSSTGFTLPWNDVTKRIVAFMLATAFLFFVLWQAAPDSALFNTREGQGLIAEFFVFVVVTALATSLVSSGMEKFIVIAMVCAAGFMLGPEAARLLGLPMPDLTPKAIMQKVGGSFHTTPSFTTAACPGVKIPWHFGTVPGAIAANRINPNATCSVNLWFDGHCLYVMQAAWAGRHTALVCHGRAIKNAEWAWSADGPFLGAVARVKSAYYK